MRLSFELAAETASAFEAFTNALVLRCWYGAPPGYYRTEVRGAFKAGQALTMVLRDGRGETITHVVSVRELGPTPRAVLMLAWDGGPLAGAEVEVRLDLVPTDGGTRVELEHHAPGALAEAYATFWQGCFARLARVLAGGVVSPWEELSNEVQAFQDPLGVAVFGVLAGLREAGAPTDAIAQVEDVVYQYLPGIDPDAAAMLDAVMRRRLAVVDEWRAYDLESSKYSAISET